MWLVCLFHVRVFSLMDVLVCFFMYGCSAWWIALIHVRVFYLVEVVRVGLPSVAVFMLLYESHLSVCTRAQWTIALTVRMVLSFPLWGQLLCELYLSVWGSVSVYVGCEHGTFT